MILAAIVLVVLAAAHYVVVTSKQGWIAAESIAVLSMLVMVVGYVIYGGESDAWFIEFSILCYAACIFGMLAVAAVSRPRERTARTIPRELWKPTKGLVVILVLGVLLTYVYFAVAGGIPFVAGLQNLVTGSDNNIRDMRLDTYKGDRYLAPGYVNQVKNVIMPAFATLTIVYLWRNTRAAGKTVAVLLGVGVVVALFGTAQRTFGLVFSASLLGAYALAKGGLSRKTVLRGGVAVLLLFALSTAALGRSDTATEQARGPVEVAGVYASEIAERFFYGQQVSALQAEVIVSDWDIPLLSDWWSTFAGYLPGQAAAQTVAGTVGRYYTGSDASTMPPSAVTSARLNISNSGAVAFFFFWGVFLATITRRLLASPASSPLYLIGTAGVMVVLGTYVSDSPVTLFQTGVLAFGLIAYVGARQYRRFESRPGADPPTEAALVKTAAETR